MISRVLFCIEIDKLLCELNGNGIDCFTDEIFVGAFAYANDILLIAPTPRSMRRMLAAW